MNGVSVICATLGRPEYQRLVASVQAQTLDRDKYEFIGWGKADEMNEYDARNMATTHAKFDVLAYVDDDTVLPPDYLEKGLKHFESPAYSDVDRLLKVAEVQSPISVMNASIRVQGALLSTKPFWTIGATLWCRREAFDALGGFEVDWGLGGKQAGWRGDTDFVWRAIDKLGEAAYLHAEDIVVEHPEAMKAHFNPQVEKAFYFRHKMRCLEILLPVDVRMAFYIPAIDEDMGARMRSQEQVERLVKSGYIKEADVPALYAEYKRVMT